MKIEYYKTKRDFTLGWLYRPEKIRHHKWIDTISDYKSMQF